MTAPARKWTPDMDDMLLFMRDWLHCSYQRCADYLNQEFGTEYTKNAAIGRLRKLKDNGVRYDLVPSDELPMHNQYNTTENNT